MINVAAALHKSQYKRQDGNLLSFNRKILRVVGIIPPEKLSESRTKKTLFILCLIFLYSTFMLLYIGQILAVYHFWGDMEATTFALVGLLGATTTQLEGIYARVYSSSILKLLEFLECNVNSKMEEMDMNESYIRILEHAKVQAKRLSITVMVWSDVMMICWIIFPFTKKYLREHNNETINVTVIQYDDKWQDFSFLIWAPFDITASPYYEITYVFQIIDVIAAIAQWKGVETTLMTLIIYASAHLKILETFLSEIKTLLSTDNVNGESLVQTNNKHSTNNAGTFTSHQPVSQLRTAQPNQECLVIDRLGNDGFKNENQKLKDFIVNFVNYHEAIIEFVGKVNKTFGPILFISFFTRQLMVCFGLFQVALTEVDGNTVTNLATCIAIMIPHFIFCWYGNELTENSLLLKQAAFENSLVQRSKEFKDFILMIMKNTQKPLRFSALGFYTLSLEEFSKTMNGIYAYFNLLKNIRGDQ